LATTGRFRIGTRKTENSTGEYVDIEPEKMKKGIDPLHRRNQPYRVPGRISAVLFSGGATSRALCTTLSCSSDLMDRQFS
jgi:hypothetical protein